MFIDALLASESATVREKVDALIALGGVYATSVFHQAETTKQFERAVELASAAEDVPLICTILTALARTLYRAMQPDAALSQFQRAIQLGQEIKEKDPKPYYAALIEFGRVSTNMNAKGGKEKAFKALDEAVTGSRELGEYTQLHADALVAMAEWKKNTGDLEGCIELVEQALTTKKLTKLEEARALTYLGAAQSEQEGGTEAALESYGKAVELRVASHANGAEHHSVAEVYIDIAAEHFERQDYPATIEALERCIPFLNLPREVLDVQFAWYKKALSLDGLEGDPLKERYRQLKQRRKEVERSRVRLPAPKKEVAEVASSFLPTPINLAPKKKKPQQKGKKKK